MKSSGRSFQRALIVLLSVTMLLSGAMTPAEAESYQYPPAPKGAVVDIYHGKKVADPYRWLENPEGKDTQEWVALENQLTTEFLSAIPAKQHFQKRLTELWNYPRYSTPSRRGEHYFFWKNDGLQNQYVLYVQDSPSASPRVLIDPNKLSEDGTIALTQQKATKDGALLAYSLSKHGSDWQEIHIKNVDTGQDYDEVLDEGVRFVGIAWKPDKSGFYYNRYPNREETENSRVYWHQLGTPQSQDVLIYERPDNRELDFFPDITDDGRYLLLNVYHGTSPKNRFYYRKLDSSAPFIQLLDQEDAGYHFIDNDGSVFYFRTDLDAPRGRIIAIDTRQPEAQYWKEIIPQNEDVISFVTTVNNQLIVAYLHDAHHQLKIYNLDGSFVREISLPSVGSIGALSGRREDQDMFFSFSSFLFPNRIYSYNVKTDQMSVFRDSDIKFDTSLYETSQVFYPSKDGTQVPMFITHRKGLKLDGSNPVLLYGYGGFGFDLTPFFSTSTLTWLEQGGVYVVANLRGGGEYGEAWHEAGMLEKKQTVFDDFIAAAEWLIDQKFTQPSKLAIMGGSNGGLLVAACMLQRPELYGAVVSQVPVTDMLRYHQFTVGRYWIPEYGNAENNPEHFKFLYAYSPLHNVKTGVSFPSTLITTADTDDRVVPAHAKKFAATLQAAVSNKSRNPILLRVETKAGHGGGKPTAKIIEEESDIYAFLFRVLDLKYQKNES